MLYCMATPSVFPDRVQVGIPEFATDFEFTHDQVGYLFDCNPDSPSNSSIAMKVEDSRIAVVQSLTVSTSDDRWARQLPDEPQDSVLNTGVGAEIVIAKDLQSCGWSVRYRANQPGLGYDLEATRDGQTLRVEVKSSIAFADIELQESEWTAAQTYGNLYVLAIVDFFGTAERRFGTFATLWPMLCLLNALP